MREDNPVRVAALEQSGQVVELQLARRGWSFEPATVEADVGAVLDQLLEIAEVVGLVTVADGDGTEIDALLAEDALLFASALGSGVGVRDDRDAGAQMRARHGAQHEIDVLGEPSLELRCPPKRV